MHLGENGTEDEWLEGNLREDHPSDPVGPPPTSPLEKPPFHDEPTPFIEDPFVSNDDDKDSDGGEDEQERRRDDDEDCL